MQITSSFGDAISSFGEAAFRQAEDSQPVPEPSTVLGLGLASSFIMRDEALLY